jgi:Ca-activated chloride channel homolog
MPMRTGIGNSVGLVTNLRETHWGLFQETTVGGRVRLYKTKLFTAALVRSLILALLLLLVPLRCIGGGIFHVFPPTLKDETFAVARLSVLLSRTLVTVSESYVDYRIDQTFFNDNDYPLDGLFLLPVGHDGASVKPDVRVDGSPTPFSLLSAHDFLPMLRNLTVSMKEPSLLGLAGNSMLVVQPLHVGVREQKSFRVHYKEPVDLENDALEFLLPLAGERYSRGPVGELNIRVRLKMSRPVRAVFSPSHHLTITREAPYRCLAEAKTEGKQVRHDFRLLTTFSGEDLDLRLFTNRSPGEKGTFMALVSPPVSPARGKDVDRDVVFLMDASGSMAKADLDLAKKAVIFGLERLRPGDRFNVLTVGTRTGMMASTLVPATADNLMKAAQFVNSSQGSGGTDMSNGLINALEQFTSRRRPGTLIFFGDGRATVGTTNREAIVEDVRRNNKAKARIFVLTMGNADVAMLDKVAVSNRGASFRVTGGQRFPFALDRFFAAVSPPLASELSVTFQDIPVDEVEPESIPDIFGQVSTFLFGRYGGTKDTSSRVRLRGRVQGRVKDVTQSFRFPQVDRSHPYLPRLWAMRRVGRLLEKESLKGSEPKLRNQIVVLAKEFGFRLPASAATPVERLYASRNDTGGLLWSYKMSPVAEDVESDRFRSVKGKVFRLDNGLWVDTEYRASTQARRVRFLSDDYFSLLGDDPTLGDYLALGPDIIVVSDKGPIRIFSDLAESQ